jgi:hypothetical protein
MTDFNLFEEMLEDSMKQAIVVTDEDRETLSFMIKETVRLAELKSKVEVLLADLTAKYNEMTIKQIPNRLVELGMNPENYSESTDTYTLTCKRVVKAALPKENKNPGLQWLRKEGHGAVIKSVIQVDIGRDEETRKEVEKLLGDNSIIFDRKEEVHHGTLTSLIKDCIKNNLELPEDKSILGIYEADVAVVKLK